MFLWYTQDQDNSLRPYDCCDKVFVNTGIDEPEHLALVEVFEALEASGDAQEQVHDDADDGGGEGL